MTGPGAAEHDLAAGEPRRTDPLARLTLEQLRQRTSMKWRTHPEDVLPLWVAEMDVPLAEPVVEALHSALALGDTGYPFGTAYAEALAAFAHDRWRWDGLRVGHTAIVPDVMMGIVEVLRLITDPGDAVVVCSPVYPPFYAFVGHDAREVVEARLGPDLRIDPQALEDAFVRARGGGRRAAFLMSNPHNPTGVVHTRRELEAVAALARRHGVRVVSDEIHAPLVLPGATFTPFLSVPGAGNAFMLASASKAWNLAGLKAAVAVAGPEAADELRLLPEEVSHGPSHLGVIAHTAAFREGGGLARRAAARARRQPAPAGRTRRGAPPRRALPPPRGHLSGLAGLPAAGARRWSRHRWARCGERRRRTRADVPRQGQGRPQLGTRLRLGRRGTRTPQLRDVADDPARSAGPHGTGGPRPLGAPPSGPGGRALENQWHSTESRHYVAAEPSRLGKDVPLYTV